MFWKENLVSIFITFKMCAIFLEFYRTNEDMKTDLIYLKNNIYTMIKILHF